MKKGRKRDGIASNNRSIQEIVSHVMGEVDRKVRQRPDEVIACWAELVGEQVAKMTCARSFEEGVLRVEVHNSILYSLLVEHERQRLLEGLKKRFPSLVIRDIFFKMG